jgi:ABC-type bacteriocin/lantibiotic exporter with double-glycine peptidase domain
LILEYIKSLPNQFDTILEDNARNLSGGQRQRLAIARAILRNTDIILFDEITSALDSENEAIISNLLLTLSKTKTVICITHKDSIKSIATHNIYIKNGTCTQ